MAGGHRRGEEEGRQPKSWSQSQQQSPCAVHGDSAPRSVPLWGEGWTMAKISDLDWQIQQLLSCKTIRESKHTALCGKAREISVEESNAQRVNSSVSHSMWRHPWTILWPWGAVQDGWRQPWDQLPCHGKLCGLFLWHWNTPFRAYFSCLSENKSKSALFFHTSRCQKLFKTILRSEKRTHRCVLYQLLKATEGWLAWNPIPPSTHSCGHYKRSLKE